MSQRAPQVGGTGACGHRGPALCMALTTDLSREDLKGSSVSVVKVQFQAYPMEASQY